MGLRQANIYVKGLAEALEMDETELAELISQNRSGGFARVWEIEDRESYAVCRVSTSKKSKDGKRFIPDFSDGFVRFVGGAYQKIKDVEIPETDDGKSLGVPIQITSCEATTFFSEEHNNTYHNYAIFAFEFSENKSDNKKSSKKTSTKKTTKTSKTTKKKASTKSDDGFEEMPLDDDLPF